MQSDAVGKPDVSRREVTIINFLRARPEGAKVQEVYDAVTALLGDNVSRPAYYKILDGLVAQNKLEKVDEPGAVRYRLPQQLYATNRITLDDLYEMIPYYASTEIMAKAIEAQQYFLENRKTIIKRAAEALTEEPAAPLFHSWLMYQLEALKNDIAIFRYIEISGLRVGQAIFADAALEYRIKTQIDALRGTLYRQLSIPYDPQIAAVPEWEGLDGLKHGGKVEYNENALLHALEKRVFGVGGGHTFFGQVAVSSKDRGEAAEQMIISGSDGSFHAGTLGLRTAQGYIEDESFVITFNNGVAYVRASDMLEQVRGSKKFIHSAPLTRQTLDDPAYKGMVMAPFMYPNLTEAEYEHMVRTATDVVQWRVDADIFTGRAKDVVTGESIMIPRIHIRDGTITPQERGFNHYYRMDGYGEFARDGINLSRLIVERIKKARGAPAVFAGAVKSTQIRLFAPLLNWYIAYGSRNKLGTAIEPNWDRARADFISDIDVMTHLLAGLPWLENGYWVSCTVIRQFASLTDFYVNQIGGSWTWYDELQRMRDDALDQHRRVRSPLQYHTLLSDDALADDSYLYLLENADYASFYIGHTSGDPSPKIPRYEFICSLRDLTDNGNNDLAAAQQSVDRTVQEIVTALLTCKVAQDRDHNFLSRLNLVKLIPSVVYMAHEFAKELGKKLEGDYKSMVVRRLAERRKQRIEEQNAVINPINIQRYIQRVIDAEKALPPPDQEDRRR